MKHRSKILFLMCTALFLLAGNALALPYNDRSAPITPHEDSINDLQDVFNNMLGVGAYDVVANQSKAAIFTNYAGSGVTNTFTFTDITKPGDIFGIYSHTNPSKRLQIFDNASAGQDQSDSQTTVMFLADGGVKIKNGQTVDDFGSAFGFYYTTKNGTFYTEDDKNADKQAYALTYQGDGQTKIDFSNVGGDLIGGTFAEHEWLVAFDGYPHGVGEKDFNDFVVLVSNIQPVPEPASIALLGIGLLGLAGFGRRKFAKK